MGENGNGGPEFMLHIRTISFAGRSHLGAVARSVRLQPPEWSGRTGERNGARILMDHPNNGGKHNEGKLSRLLFVNGAKRAKSYTKK